jgi:hypothetical protein
MDTDLNTNTPQPNNKLGFIHRHKAFSVLFFVLVVVAASSMSLYFMSDDAKCRVAGLRCNDNPPAETACLDGATACDDAPEPPKPVTYTGFKEDDYGISFEYPDSMTVVSEDDNSGLYVPQYFKQSGGKVLASFAWPQEQFPNTNFAQASITVAANENAPTLADCNQITGEGQTSTGVRDGIFYRFETTGAAAGTQSQAKVYHVLRDDVCLELSLVVMNTNLGNYDPGTVQQFDSDKVWEALNHAVMTFKLAPSASVKTYTNTQYGFSFDYPKAVEVGKMSSNSSLGTADVKVPGVFVGSYVFVVANTNQLRADAEDYYNSLAEAADNPPSPEQLAEGPAIFCEKSTVKNAVSIQLVSCQGEGGPATYGLIKGPNYDIFVDGYSRGWDYNLNLKPLSMDDLVQILETFKFTS